MSRVLVKKVNEPAVVVEDSRSHWDIMKDTVTGYVERYSIGRGILIHLDEEGKCKDMPMNFLVGLASGFELIVGDVVFLRRKRRRGRLSGSLPMRISCSFSRSSMGLNFLSMPPMSLSEIRAMFE